MSEKKENQEYDNVSAIEFNEQYIDFADYENLDDPYADVEDNSTSVMSYEQIIDPLNDRQKEAVLNVQGPTLVIAGAGSGKTKLLTHKIAYLICHEHVKPWNILAITFTNKAAKEMNQRVKDLIGNSIADDIWIGTFHSICTRILRKHITELGFTSNFTIYDAQDQKTVIKRILKSQDVETDATLEKVIISKISNAKNNMQTPAQLMAIAKTEYDKIAATTYTAYQRILKESNAIDFDDIINYTLEIFEQNPEAKEYYANKFQYVFVDEYQDTNKAQFTLTKIFSSKHKNITAVGDNDQGIYSFRGADIQNILNFTDTFPNTKVIKLEQNYRSTQNILNVANAVIKNNDSKYEKTLWTNNEKGDDVVVHQFDNEWKEAEYVSKVIDNLVMDGKNNYSDFAILYRANNLSRVFEEKMIQKQIPYNIIGGFKFYDRKEIKDVMAYLKLVNNPKDNISFLRVVNEPKRGIGQTSINKMQQIADSQNISLFEVAKNVYEFGLKALEPKLQPFIQLIEYYAQNKDNIGIMEIFNNIFEKSGYKDMLENDIQKNPADETRLENILELYNVISEFEQKEEEDKSLEAFLESVSLVSDSDQLDQKDHVTLMTMHTSKGLEYPVVFLIGMEEGIFPSNKSIAEEGAIEEERRLCYVGMTRAKKTLFLSCSYQRNMYGQTSNNPVSRFVEEIPKDFAKFSMIERQEVDFEKPYWSNTNGLDNDTFFRKQNFDYTKGFAKSTKTFDSWQRSATSFLEELKNKKNTTNNKATTIKEKEKEQKQKEQEKTTNKKEETTSGWQKGDIASHAKFGKGEVLQVIPDDGVHILDIQFPNARKKLVAEYADLDKEN